MKTAKTKTSASRTTAPQRLLDDSRRLTTGAFGAFAESVVQFANQCRQVVADTKRLKLPSAYRQVDNVVINGMGGSGLGTDVLLSAFAAHLRCPVVLTHDYIVPNFVGPRTLYLACSYSGNTEEVLAALRHAHSCRAKIAAMSAGGRLAQTARRLKLPAYVYATPHNPSGQPRLGLGYSMLGVWALLGKAGVLPYTEKLVHQFLAATESASRRFAPTVLTSRNRAKLLALALHGRLPLIISGNPLSGVSHTFANQCHESAKHLTAHLTLPELNNHLLEGLKHPTAARTLATVLIESPNDLPAVRRRIAVTAQVFARHRIPVLRYRTARGPWIAQAGEALQLGVYTSWYLAALNGVNPQAIPWVDFFKAQLAKR